MKKKTSQNGTFEKDRRAQFAFYAVLWALPLFIGILWGPYFDGDVYNILRQTHARVNRLTIPPESVTSPLHTLALLLPTALGWPTHLTSLVLSCLGWGLVATTIHRTGVALKRPLTGAVAALLTAFSPLVTQTLGSPIAWSTAWACLALLATIEQRWQRQTIACMLLLATHGSVGTLALVMLLWGVRWRVEKRLPRRSSVLLVLATLTWTTAVLLGLVAAPQLRLDGQAWIEALRTLVRTSEFYWLFVPWIIIGAWNTPHKAVWAIWLAAIFVDGGDTARAIGATLALWFTTVGIDTTLKWLHHHKITRLHYRALAGWGTLLACLPLIIAQGDTLAQSYSHRPLAQYALMRQAGIWLRGTTPEAVIIFGPEVVGYWAERSTVAWEGQDNAPATLAQQLSRLDVQTPEYCVTATGLAWTQLTRLRAFTDAYVPVHTLAAPHSPHTLTIWQRRFPAASLETATPLNVDMPGGIELVGYSHTPAHAEPGEPLHVTLFLRATKPVTQSYYTRLSLRSPVDGLIHGQHGALLPRSTLVNWWKPGQIIAEHIPVTATQDLPVGAYHVVMDVLTPDMEAVLPLHQDDDTAILAEVALGYVARPWQGSFANARPASADFGGQIRLVGFEAPDALTPGSALDVTLYWETLQAPGEDYTVFVHLLDSDGQLVSSHDGLPMAGGYPTGAWLPGDTIPDTHTLPLDPTLPAGTYRLNVGMYRRPSLEHLIVRDAEGEEQPDRALFLQTLTVP